MSLTPEQQTQFVSLRRQLREMKGLTEAPPGVFRLRTREFMRLAVDEQGPHALLTQVGPRADQSDRFALDTPVQHRKLKDEAKKRLAYLLED